MNDRSRLSCLVVVLTIVLGAGPAVAQTTSGAAATGPTADLPGADWDSDSFLLSEWPRGTNPTAQAFVDQAAEMMRQGMLLSEVRPLFEQAIATDPEQPYAWWRLGSMQVANPAEFDEGMRRMRHQWEVAPSPAAYVNAAVTLRAFQHADEAIAIFREGLEKYPEDGDLNALLGEALVAVHRYDEAVGVLRPEFERRPGSSRLAIVLGRAYLRAGRADEAVPYLVRAGELEPSPAMLSRAATELANAGRELDVALDYARRGWAEVVPTLTGAELPPPEGAAYLVSGTLLRLWNALSLVHLKRGEFEAARPYTAAALEAGRTGEMAIRLSEIDFAHNDRDAGSRDLALASLLDRQRSSGEDGADRAMIEARAELARLQGTVVRRRAPGPAVPFASVFVLLDATGHVIDATVARRAVDVPDLVGQLGGLQLGPAIPDAPEARLLESFSLRCDADAPTCRVLRRSASVAGSPLRLE